MADPIIIAEAAHAAESSGIVGTFGLDWKMFIAQFVNFAIVLIVLKKLIFGPVTKLLAERQNTIERGAKAAEAAQHKLAEIEASRAQAMKEARAEAANMIRGAQADAAQLGERMKEQAKAEVEGLVRQGKERLRMEQEALRRELADDVSKLIVEAAGKVLGEAVDEKKGKKISDAAVKEWVGTDAA